MEYVHGFSDKWFHLGLSLGLQYHTLKHIEASGHNADVGDHMMSMLQEWLNGAGSLPNWGSLAVALESPLVREGEAAQKIRSEHQL